MVYYFSFLAWMQQNNLSSFYKALVCIINTVFLLFLPFNPFSNYPRINSWILPCICMWMWTYRHIVFERPGHGKDPHMLDVNILLSAFSFESQYSLDDANVLIVPISLQFMVLNMPLELMTTQRVVSLRLNLDNALASSLGSQYLWGRQAGILSRLESSWSASQQTIMVIPITWLLRTAIISVMIFVTSWQGTQCQNGWIDLQE